MKNNLRVEIKSGRSRIVQMGTQRLWLAAMDVGEYIKVFMFDFGVRRKVTQQLARVKKFDNCLHIEICLCKWRIGQYQIQ